MGNSTTATQQSVVQPQKVLLLFSSASAANGSAFPAELAGLLNEADKAVAAYTATFDDLLFCLEEKHAEVIDTRNDRPLTEYDVVYFRHWGDAEGSASATARFCKIKGIPFVDDEALHFGSFNKITQYMNLFEANIPFPKTLIGSHEQLLAQYKARGFSFPIVLKSSTGTRGLDNYMVRNEAAMRRILAENQSLTFVLQVFIPNTGDYRVVVMGVRVVLVIARKARGGSHLNNTSQGGSATLIPVDELPKKVRDMAVRAATFFGRQVAGVDMVQSTDNGRYYCFEVNRAPQIEHASFEREKAEALGAYLRDVAERKHQKR